MFVVNDRNLSIAILSYSHHRASHIGQICQVAPLLTSCHIREPPNCNLLHSPCIMHAPLGEYKYFVPSAIAPPKLHRSPLWPSFVSRQIRNLPTFAAATATGSRPFIPNYLDSLPHSTRSKGSKFVSFLSVPDNPPPHHRRIVRHIAT